MAEQYRKYAIPHPQWKDFPNNLPPNTRIDRMTRERLPIVPDPALGIFEITVKTQHTVRIYRRKDTSVLPVFVYQHGGGFVKGGLETDDKTCRAIAKGSNVCVLSIEYRLAPEHPFPIGFEDCWEVLCWTRTKEAETQLSIDLKKGFLVGGTSAGANFTASLAHRYYHSPPSPTSFPITGLVFWAGSWCHPDVRPAHLKPYIMSVDEIDDAPGLTKSSIEYFWKQCGAPKDELRYSPLLHKETQWKGVAQKVYFAICGWDPRRDEAILFADMMRKQGLDVKDKMYPGLPHGFWTTCPDLPISEEWEQDTLAGIEWLLQ